ncbi:MAG TPA: 50S ribosomal protein L35 [Candidatus Paceibacterota bacterium]
MKKSVTKRIRKTRTGKMMRRTMAQDHFRAGKPQKYLRNKRKSAKISAQDYKRIIKYQNR